MAASSPPAEVVATAAPPVTPVLSSNKRPDERWSDFPGPMVKPPVADGVALVVGPIQASDWTRQLSIYYVKVRRADGDILVVEGIDNDVLVPGAFVAPPRAQPTLKVGTAVLFQRTPGMTLGTQVGRITKVGKTSDGIVYTVKNKFVDEVEETEVVAPRVWALDGTLVVGAPVSFEIDGKRCAGEYIGPGRDSGSSWVLSVSKPKEKTGVKPLVMRPFKKGAKVVAVFGTTSMLSESPNHSMEPRQYLENGTVVEVIAGGLEYKVRHDDGSPTGEVSTLSLDDVFAR